MKKTLTVLLMVSVFAVSCKSKSRSEGVTAYKSSKIFFHNDTLYQTQESDTIYTIVYSADRGKSWKTMEVKLPFFIEKKLK